MTLTKGMQDLLDTYGLTLVTNHSMTTDEILELFGFEVAEDGEIIAFDGFDKVGTGFYWDDVDRN